MCFYWRTKITDGPKTLASVGRVCVRVCACVCWVQHLLSALRVPNLWPIRVSQMCLSLCSISSASRVPAEDRRPSIANASESWSLLFLRVELAHCGLKTFALNQNCRVTGAGPVMFRARLRMGLPKKLGKASFHVTTGLNLGYISDEDKLLEALSPPLSMGKWIFVIMDCLIEFTNFP